MNYQKLEPVKNLLHAIEAYCFYTTDDSEIISDYFFPNGKPAIVFHLQTPFKCLNLFDEWEIMPPVSFIPCASAPVQLISGGNSDTIAVILNPCSVYNMYNIRINSGNILIDASQYIPTELFQKLKANTAIEYRMNVLDTYFTGKFVDYCPEKDLLRMICDYIIQNFGIVDRYSVAKEFGVSENYIHKLFIQKLGISFKPYIQIVRISNILKEVYTSNNNDWFEIFEKYGYYDQAHFIKDFKKITSKTPQQYYRLDKTFSDIFSALA